MSSPDSDFDTGLPRRESGRGVSESGAPEGLAPLPPLNPAQVRGLDDPALMQQCVLEAPWGSSQRRIGLGLSGLYCAACAINIEDALKKVPGVQEVQVQAHAQRARILLDPAQASLSALVAAVQALGYRAWPDGAARAGHERLRERRALLWQLSVAGLCMMQVMMITWAQYVATPGAIPADLWALMNWACWVLSLPVLLFSCRPFFRGAWGAALQGRIAMDTPVALGMAAAFLVSTGATFGGEAVWGHEVYFDSFTMFVTFLLAGRYLERRARERVTHSLESLCLRLPESVGRLLPKHPQTGASLDEAEIELTWPSEPVPLSALGHGDRVRVAVGQAFPGDGQLIAGQTQVDEALLTGESRPVPRQRGQVVVAGSLNVGAPVCMVIERLGPETRYQHIVALVQQALSDKPGWVRTADRFAAPFLWGVLALALGGALAWQWIDPARSLWVAVSVLVVTCPCALSLAAPSALLAAAGAMAQRGLLVRRIEAIEALAKVDQVLFDKTGTLTEGGLSLLSVRSLDAQVLSLQDPRVAGGLTQALALASCSQHPLARSLVQALLPWCQQVPSALPASSWQAVQEQAGKGIEGRDAQGRVWRLGSARWALGPGRSPQADVASRVWLAAEDGLDEPIGFVFDEVFRADASGAIAALRDGLSCDVALLSGDQADRVADAAQQLGRGRAVRVAGAQATPEVKLAVLSAAQSQGHCVVVVGDGINDAPVLAKADVSVVLDQGASLAQSQADMVVLGGRLLALPAAMHLSRKAMRVVHQNLVWALGYNLVCIPLALSGRLPPWLAGLGMALSSLFVVLNALRLNSPVVGPDMLASPLPSST